MKIKLSIFLIFVNIFGYSQGNSIMYGFGSFLNNIQDLDGRIPAPFEIGADMGTYTFSLQSDVRKGKTYISNLVGQTDDISIDTRYIAYGKISDNHHLGGYGQFTTTSMAVDGATTGISYRYFNKPKSKITFFSEILFPILGFNKIRRYHPINEKTNSIIFGTNLNGEYKARNTEIRLKVGIIFKHFVN